MLLGIRGAWVAHNLRHLGSGAFYHLAYATHLVHPDLLPSIRKSHIPSRKAYVYLIREEKGYLIADGEVVSVHWFPELIRVHFIIGKTYYDEPVPVTEWMGDYLLRL